MAGWGGGLKIFLMLDRKKIREAISKQKIPTKIISVGKSVTWKIKCKHSGNDIKKISEDVEGKLERMESRIKTQRKQLEENNAKITCLELRVEELENKFANEKKNEYRKMKDLENSIKNWKTASNVIFVILKHHQREG